MSASFVFAVIIGVVIVAATLWSIKFIAAGPPPEPDLDDVREVDVPYVCSVCGMSLTMTQASGEDVAAPRHCREDMIRA